jgi:glycosyltransferase involved in cell wall biosynthesis
MDPETAKDRGIALRALVIDAEVPQPDKDAGSYAAIQEMSLLQTLGLKLTFVPQNLAYLGNYTEALQRRGIECAYAPFIASVEDLIQRRGREFDVYYITRYSVAERYIHLIRSVAPNAKILFCNADLHFLREMRHAIANGDKALLAKSVQTREAELAVMRHVDVTLSYTEVEQAVILSHNLDSSKVARCPWVIEVPERVPGFRTRKAIAFLGNFRHPPNAEAVTFFAKDVMPLLAKRLPGVTFHVYGSNAPAALKELASETVRIEGYIPKTSDAYDTCRIFVAPLRSGAGIKGKVIDALAHGAPTVLSPLAAEGIGIRHGKEALIADKPEEWVNAIAEIYDDEKRWCAISEAARSFAGEQYSAARGLRLMRSALEQAGIYI